MLNDKIYQAIYDELVKYLPDKWDKLIAYFEYGEASYTFSFYVKIDGTFVKCYDLVNTSENILIASYSKIDKILSIERKKIADGNIWSNMTMVVTSTGNMETYFDYTDLSEVSYQYRRTWKKKYLQ